MKAARNLVQSLQPQAITSPEDLLKAGLIPPDHLADVTEASATLPVSITSHITGLIDASSPDGAIAKQFIPAGFENTKQEEELASPLPGPRLANARAHLSGLLPILFPPRGCWRRLACCGRT